MSVCALKLSSTQSYQIPDLWAPHSTNVCQVWLRIHAKQELPGSQQSTISLNLNIIKSSDNCLLLVFFTASCSPEMLLTFELSSIGFSNTEILYLSSTGFS